MQENDIQSSKLSELRDALLPKLMSGEIDVSDIQLEAAKLSFTTSITLTSGESSTKGTATDCRSLNLHEGETT